MEESQKILIIEDAAGIASMYKELLGKKYDVTICHTGVDAIQLIENGEKFDLVISDIVLPPEDMTKTLVDCQETGIRLIQLILEKGISRRIYVITVVKASKKKVTEICTQYNAILRFEYKLDHDPEEFVGIVEKLLEQK